MMVPLQHLNEPQEQVARTALALLEPLPPTPELVDALIDVGFEAFGSPQECVAVIGRALGVAEQLGLGRPARALGYLAIAKSVLGDPRCLDDFREAIALAVEAGDGRTAGSMHNNYAIWLKNFEGPAAALGAFTQAAEFSNARGLWELVLGIRAGMPPTMIDLGRPEDALRECDLIRPQAEAVGDDFDLIEILSSRALALAYLGRPDEATEDEGWLVAAARHNGRPERLVGALGSLAQMHVARGASNDARAVLEEIDSTPRLDETPEYAHHAAMHVRNALAIGSVDLAERLAGHLRPRDPLTEHVLCVTDAMLAEALGDVDSAAAGYEDAARRFEAFGVVPEQAFALFGQGRCLVELSRPTEAEPVLQHAREIFERLKAAPALAETDGLLQQATALSS